MLVLVVINHMLTNTGENSLNCAPDIQQNDAKNQQDGGKHR